MAGSWSNSAVSLIILIEEISGYSGIFGYSPTPGAGNLVFSLTAAAGTDPYGNVYPAGLNVGFPDQPQVHLGYTANSGFIQLPTHSTFENVISEIVSVVANDGTALENLYMLLRGPSETVNTDRIDVRIQSEYHDGSIPARFMILNGVTQANLVVVDTAAITLERNTTVFPNSSSDVGLTVESFAGTGDILHLNSNFTPLTKFDPTGAISEYASNAFTPYTPAVTGVGTATFSTQTGWYQRVGKMVMFTAYLVINAAGSGATNVTITTPTNIDRTTRQIIPLHAEGAFSAGLLSNGHAVAFTGGTGAVIDRLRTSNNGANNADANITGADLLAGTTITIEGWYREA